MTHRTPTRRLAARLLPLALAVGAWLATPAAAGPPHGRHRVVHGHAKHHGHGSAAHRSRVRVHAGHRHRYPAPRVHARFVIPLEITHRHAERFRPYYHGSVYFAPHRHRHAVYDFPVWTARGYVSTPHAYCDGTLYRGHAAYHGPRLNLEIGF